MKITNNTSKYRTEFAIQHTTWSFTELDKIMNAMSGLNAHSYGMIPFSDELPGADEVPTDIPIVPLGSTKLISMYHDGLIPENWVVFHDVKAFSQAFYQGIMGPELLNHSAKIMTLQEALAHGKFDETLFIKPSDDLKMFAGVIVEAGESLEEVLGNMQHQELLPDSAVVVAPWQQLRREFRVIVVDGVPAGFSQYKNDKQQVQSAVLNLADRDRLYFKASNLHKHWHPAPVYTIDFAEVGPNRTLKVVEYNGFNCSGMYMIDRNRVFRDVAAYVDKYF